MTVEDLVEVLRNNPTTFAGLLGTVHATRFTGVVALHFLNGEPQQAEFGRPHVVVFPRPGSVSTKPLDSASTSATSSSA